MIIFFTSKGYCYRVADSVNVCSAPYSLFEPSQSQCTGLGGTWLLCPQCPTDKVCAQSICKPICSVGVECRYSPDTVTLCSSGVLSDGKCTILGDLVTTCPSGYTLSNGACMISGTQTIVCPSGYTLNNSQCFKNGQTISVCPANSKWDSTISMCVLTPDVSIKCLDGSAPVNNVCYAIPDGYIKCPTTQILSNGKCVSMSDLVVVTPLPGQGSNFVWIYIIVILVVLIIILILTKFKRKR
jgi:hypothetical protein